MTNEEKRQTVTFRLSPDTVKRVKRIREMGLQPSRIIDDLIQAFCIHAGMEPDENGNVAAPFFGES